MERPRPKPRSPARPAPSVHGPMVPVGSSPHRVVAHLDMDCFYAQVEMIYNPELKGKPLGVQQKYLVVTCNYDARKLGVKKLMSIRDAKEKCPQLVLVNGEDLTRYREMSYKVTELLEEFSPVVERLGFDENFVDITELVEKRMQQLPSNDWSTVSVVGHVYNNQSVNPNDILHVRLLIGSQIAAEMREAIHSRLGLTGCAGVASNKLLSKLVSGTFKPNQQTVLMPESCQDLISSLDHIKQMPGIGFKTTKRLESLGVSSVHDLQTFSPDVLEKELGISVAQRIQKLSFGEDNSPVTPSGPPQSFSEEDSIRKCSTEEDAKKKIEELLANLLERVYKDGRKPHTIRLTIRRFSAEKSFNRESRQCPIPSHVIQKLGTGSYDVMTPMINILMKLFRNMVNVKVPFHLTLLSVCFSNLKALPTSKKGTIEFYLTPSSSSTSHSGKKTHKIKDTHLEDLSQDKDVSWDFLPTGRIESTKTGESPLDPTNYPKEKEFSLQSLPAGIDHEVFSQLPLDIQEELISGKPGEKLHGKRTPSYPLRASKGVLSFFPQKDRQDHDSNPREQNPTSAASSKHSDSLATNEPGTSGLSRPGSAYLFNLKDPSSYLESVSRDGGVSQCPKEPQAFHLSDTSPAVSNVHSVPDLQSRQLFSTEQMAADQKWPTGTLSQHQGAVKNQKQDSAEEEITFPSDIDPTVFFELPKEVQNELLAEWKRAESSFQIEHE
ncbi:DNA polymerase iota isoform X1 [Tachyglossus aculeatus]|uniref:DNA polymerase iota isoform X1 n=2 Tax=Tachyglossus aculeatus TaxID=9261 RepID=UPI0018F3B2D7|nr:DNA polymerase iota isoform X1 [Tachyglossus aculeatus]